MSLTLTSLSAGSPGQTSFLVNLGVKIARDHPDQKVVIVDFNFMKPDMATFHDLVDYSKNELPPSLDDLYSLLYGMQTILIEEYLSVPFKNLPNYYVLPGFLMRSNLEDNLERRHWDYLFSNLNEFADVLIFDTDDNVRHTGFKYLIGQTDHFLLTMEQDPLAVVHARYFLDLLTQYERNKDTTVILLRSTEDNPLEPDTLGQMLRSNVSFQLPNIIRKRYEDQIYSVKPIAFDDKDIYTQSLQPIIELLLGESAMKTVKINKKGRSKWLPSHLMNLLHRSGNIS